ncbi:metallophosphoesterase family protein [Streptomyces nanhaiensis]|uniref:metallophosphoesterase family protein n=1 Tax=Streptomyces nanhaiensis TaxID=679319 RepID=UPI00399C52CB
MLVLIMSDTHIPKRAGRLPQELMARVAEADVVVHAGDWVDTATLDLLQERSRRLIGVYGNNDGPGLRARLPEVARAELDGLRLGVVHETGPKQGREKRCAERFGDLDVLVFGHSHIPWDTTATTAAGTPLRLLNPGSPTDRRSQPYRTCLTAVVEAGRLEAVELHRLPPRG